LACTHVKPLSRSTIAERVEDIHSRLHAYETARQSAIQGRINALPRVPSSGILSPEEADTLSKRKHLEWLRDHPPRLPETTADVVCVDSSDLKCGILTGHDGHPSIAAALMKAVTSRKPVLVPSSYRRLGGALKTHAKANPLMTWAELSQFVAEQEASFGGGFTACRGLLGRAMAFLHAAGKGIKQAATRAASHRPCLTSETLFLLH